MNRQALSSFLPQSRGSWLRCGVLLAVLVGALLVPPVSGEPATSTAPAGLTIKGTCTFRGKNSTWSATLTPKGENLYDADYTATWGGKPLSYKGTIKSDFKTDISGEGASKSNGTFQFAGKYDTKGIAQCSYKEVGPRNRSGTLTAEQAQK